MTECVLPKSVLSPYPILKGWKKKSDFADHEYGEEYRNDSDSPEGTHACPMRKRIDRCTCSLPIYG